jgi:hypothetical protein
MIRPKIIKLFCLAVIFILPAGCVPFDKIVSHDFADGYYKLRTPNEASEKVYIILKPDSVTIYPVNLNDRFSLPEPGKIRVVNINNIKPDNIFYNSTFIKTSIDIDLSTIILKFRPAMADVPHQLNANANGIIYSGYRKDFYKIKSRPSLLQNENAIVRHTGFDLGLFTHPQAERELRGM